MLEPESWYALRGSSTSSAWTASGGRRVCGECGFFGKRTPFLTDSRRLPKSGVPMSAHKSEGAASLAESGPWRLVQPGVAAARKGPVMPADRRGRHPMLPGDGDGPSGCHQISGVIWLCRSSSRLLLGSAGV